MNSASLADFCKRSTIDTDGEPQIYRLITSLTDIALFPASLLATEYHRRWEVENTIDELKVHLLGRLTPIRSRASS